MYSACTVWLIGPSSPEFSALGIAIEAAGGQSHPLMPNESVEWRKRVREGEYRGPLPNLLFVDAELGYGHPDGHLEELLTSPPWMFLPLVVLSRRDQPEQRVRAYIEGAAAWITLPADKEALDACFAQLVRYWVKTAVLPELTLPL